MNLIGPDSLWGMGVFMSVAMPLLEQTQGEFGI